MICVIDCAGITAADIAIVCEAGMLCGAATVVAAEFVIDCALGITLGMCMGGNPRTDAPLNSACVDCGIVADLERLTMALGIWMGIIPAFDMTGRYFLVACIIGTAACIGGTAACIGGIIETAAACIGWTPACIVGTPCIPGTPCILETPASVEGTPVCIVATPACIGEMAAIGGKPAGIGVAAAIGGYCMAFRIGEMAGSIVFTRPGVGTDMGTVALGFDLGLATLLVRPWMRFRCLVRLVRCLKESVHTSQWYGVSPVWTRRCDSKLHF
mmetsp:Transcript_19509/g.39482  ORF Transcript_19509/g.39482 Transcript_19509/m.39482 type:complete len:271 (-) Transcript_19509:418-1230(-)